MACEIGLQVERVFLEVFKCRSKHTECSAVCLTTNRVKKKKILSNTVRK